MAFENWARARRDPDFRAAAVAANLTEKGALDACETEADGTPTWARWQPNSPKAGDLLLQVDVDLAVAAAFVAT